MNGSECMYYLQEKSCMRTKADDQIIIPPWSSLWLQLEWSEEKKEQVGPAGPGPPELEKLAEKRRLFRRRWKIRERRVEMHVRKLPQQNVLFVRLLQFWFNLEGACPEFFPPRREGDRSRKNCDSGSIRDGSEASFSIPSPCIKQVNMRVPLRGQSRYLTT